MAMKFMDGFDYLTNPNLALKWDSTITNWNSLTPGIYGKGSAILIHDANQLIHTLNANYASGCIGMHIQVNYLPGANIAFMLWKDAATTQVDLRIDATGALFFTRNGTAIGSSTLPQYRLTSGQTYWIEAQVVIDSSLGQANLYINSNSVLAQTGLNTKNTSNLYFNQVGIQGSNTYSNLLNGDNFHFWDLSVGDVGGFPYGEHIIDTQLANAVGTNTTWNEGGSIINASNYAQVNEAHEDGDTTYVAMSASGAGDIDSYGFANLVETAGTIGTVAINTIARIDDAGPHTYEHYTLSGGTSALSSDISPGANYLNEQTFQGTDPHTGVAWTLAGRNAAEFGYKLIS